MTSCKVGIPSGTVRLKSQACRLLQGLSNQQNEKSSYLLTLDRLIYPEKTNLSVHRHYSLGYSNK